jgi:PAS domain S-box-containing protein
MNGTPKRKLVSSNEMNRAKAFHETGLRVADYIDAMLSYWDKKSICRFANTAYLDWFGKKKKEVVHIMSRQMLTGLSVQEQACIQKVLKGEKQILESVAEQNNGSARFFITTYYPDMLSDEVVGYFEHIIDISSIKKMELKMLEMEQAKKRELLRSVIETQETEREAVAYELKDKINQTLAYCKMMLEKESIEEPHYHYLKNFSQYIHQAIDELNALSNKMSPSAITMLGFVAGVKEYILAFQQKRKVAVSFHCDATPIENMRSKDKIALFRILQDFLMMLANNPKANRISLSVAHLHPSVILQLSHNDPTFTLPVMSKEYKDIIYRIEYFGGHLKDAVIGHKRVLEIQLLDIE